MDSPLPTGYSRQEFGSQLRPEKIDSLTSLRFLMILMIFISHLEFLSGGTTPNAYDLFFHNPNIAVEFFFILSSFGLTYSFLRKGRPASEAHWTPIAGYKYAFRRVKKLYWLYLLTLVVGVPFLIYDVLQEGVTWQRILFTSAQVVLPPFFLQSLFGRITLSHALNGVCWFYSTLFILYAFYPLLERLFSKIIKKKSDAFIAIAIDLLLLTCAYLLLEFIQQKITLFNDLTYSTPYIRVFEFLLGIFLAYLFWFSKPFHRDGLYSFLEIFSLFLTFSWYFLEGICPDSIPSVLLRLADIVVAGFLLYSFAFQGGHVSAILSHRPFVFLGTLSSFIYLIHYPVRIYFGRWVLAAFEPSLTRNSLFISGIVVITALLSVGAYFLNQFISHKKNFTSLKKID